ncbi:protein TASOR isoform X2 [Anolis carolinensis]|uniref:Transcription activation suppressor n=1 Tax=Anolis carolinensis TaxID=28377 RepID=A0A803SYN9_ANOCA|nr:PREDICTED: protein TASOR isoform X2 [Anolis carolinensis]|eukprot:XP_003217801.1 PREDICTED: protein TASOR isoform X2 [Anolis carolinensis]
MAEASAAGGCEKAPGPPQRAERSSSSSNDFPSGAEAEAFSQNGARPERSQSGDEEAAAALLDLPKAASAADDVPLKRNFQIPRKSREKKALFQPLTKESREFEDVMNILHSSYLEVHSKDNFIYKQASLIHNELFEKEFIEKRRELKRDGRLEKELVETYAFLKVDRELVQNICENGLQAGHSKITVLGSPFRGVYLSKYADLLQANPLDGKATGDIIIFKVIKGRTKTIYDNLGGNPMDSIVKNALDPTPKYECHISKNANRITSVLTYRAFERTQYYFYEYGFDEIRQRPRHVCPYAVVSFSCKGEKVQKYLPQARSKISNVDKSTDNTSYTLWNGQLLNRGTLVCHAALKSETRPLLPCKLPEKLDVDMVMSIEHLKQRFSTRALQKEAYSGEREEFRSGMYCSLYEIVEKTRSGSNLEGLLQKLETDKLVIVKPLVDGGYLLLLSPHQMASPYENRTGNPRTLQALFLFRNPRCVVTSAHKNEMKNENTSILQEPHVVMPEFTRFIQSLHYAYVNSRKDPRSDLNTTVEKYINDYLKRYSKYKEFVLFDYKDTLDEKKHLYPAPKNKSHIDSSLRAYIFGSDAYQMPVSKAKKLMDGYQKPQQFSPVSDCEAPEEESDYTKRKAKKRNNSKSEEIAAKRKPNHPRDYDQESIKELINLIHRKKKNIDNDSDTEDSRIENQLKRKLEGDSAPETLHSMIADLGGHDTDLRQQNISESPVPDSSLLMLLSKILSNPELPSTGLIKQPSPENYSDQAGDIKPIAVQIKEEPQFLVTAHVENTHLMDPQSPVKLETNVLCLPYSVDVSSCEADTTNHMRHLKDISTGSVSSFDGCSSPCSNTPLEQSYHRQNSSSNSISTTGINWKLMPIIGLKSRDELFAYSPPKDASENDPRAISRRRNCDYPSTCSAFSDSQEGRIEDEVNIEQETKFEEQLETETNYCMSTSINGLIETAILEEYTLFTSKIQEMLKQKNIIYASRISRPVISAQERVMRLSEYICLQASDIAVQEYVERLSENLNNVILTSSCGIQSVPITCSSELVNDSDDTELNLPSVEIVPLSGDLDMEQFPEPPCSKVEGDSFIDEQDHLKTFDTGKEHSPLSANMEMKLAAEPNVCSADPVQQTDKVSKVADNSKVTTKTAVVGLISQLKPEVFDSIVKIMQDVQKNTVKFYIYEEQESTLCKEIKEYLTKLGNTECHPEQFLRRRADLDKLLIIIQNEDIANLIHKIPRLVTLKRLPCVSFAGVDSLDDVKNHTYNELFVSGGFIVSDESVLNPESVTVDKLSSFLKFLEELSTPDGKWQWKVHCKIQKKLKELGRTNANATSLLTLLNTYQKKHMVEILSYHSCDSQTRNPPELDCLIKLQAQNIQQRHIVFLTEKNVLTASCADNGIVVASLDLFMQNFKSLVGYHNLITDENCLPPPVDPERQSAPIENEKDEEDMSLDSGDETSQIEVCNDASKYDSHVKAFEKEAKGFHGADCGQKSQADALLPAEGRHCLLTEKTSKIDMQDIQPVTPVSTTRPVEGERTNSVEQVPLNNFQIYNRQLSVPHQFSHFNVLTHQTFLGPAYPMSTNQNQEGGNYFLSAYGQNLDMGQSPSPNSWDIRPFSKQN